MSEQPDYGKSPFAKQVHVERKSSQVEGLDENTRSGLRGKFVESILQLVVQALTGFFNPALSAFAQLTNWVTVLLPAQIMEPIQQLVTLLITVLDSIPIIGPPAGDLVEYLAQLFGLMKDTTSAAQTTGDTALSEVQLLKATVEGQVYGGAVITEDFQGANSTTLADYVQINVGGTSGTYGRQDGVGHYYGSFGTDQQILSRKAVGDVLTLNTSSQRAAMKTMGPIGGSGDTNVMVIARASADMQNFVFCQFLNANGVFGYVLGGVSHVVSTLSSPSKGVELLEIELGAPGVPVGTNDWFTGVKKNGKYLAQTTVDLTLLNPACSIFLTSTCRSPVFGAGADNFFGLQAIPCDIDTLTWADTAPS